MSVFAGPSKVSFTQSLHAWERHVYRAKSSRHYNGSEEIAFALFRVMMRQTATCAG